MKNTKCDSSYLFYDPECPNDPEGLCDLCHDITVIMKVLRESESDKKWKKMMYEIGERLAESWPGNSLIVYETTLVRMIPQKRLPLFIGSFKTEEAKKTLEKRLKEIPIGKGLKKLS